MHLLPAIVLIRLLNDSVLQENGLTNAYNHRCKANYTGADDRGGYADHYYLDTLNYMNAPHSQRPTSRRRTARCMSRSSPRMGPMLV
jgi:hypothetical protein